VKRHVVLGLACDVTGVLFLAAAVFLGWFGHYGWSIACSAGCVGAMRAGHLARKRGLR